MQSCCPLLTSVHGGWPNILAAFKPGCIARHNFVQLANCIRLAVGARDERLNGSDELVSRGLTACAVAV